MLLDVCECGIMVKVINMENGRMVTISNFSRLFLVNGFCRLSDEQFGFYIKNVAIKGQYSLLEHLITSKSLLARPTACHSS